MYKQVQTRGYLLFFALLSLFGTLNVLSSSYTTSAQQRPYLRTYGNDVIAGGDFEDAFGTCSALNNERVRGFGQFNGVPGHDTYVGAGSELAVFAQGQIEQFLPGAAVSFIRSRLDYLSFANAPAGLPVSSGASPQFSGGFGERLCSDSFPDTSTGFISVNGNAHNGRRIDELITDIYGPVSPGDRVYIEIRTPAGGPGRFFYLNGGVVPRGVDFRLVVIANGPNPEEARLVLTDNITFDGNGVWATREEIPTASFYSNGDLHIHHTVNVLNGIFNVDQTAYTCTNGETVLTTSDAGFIEANCDNKLTLHGSLTARDAQFYRINGDIAGASVAEGYGSGNLAEAFVFSPDIYLALLANQSSTSINTTRVDAIRTLPPAL